ncbi:MAG: hypothetical protein WCG03_01025 [Kiritimatiellales bacterium]
MNEPGDPKKEEFSVRDQFAGAGNAVRQTVPPAAPARRPTVQNNSPTGAAPPPLRRAITPENMIQHIDWAQVLRGLLRRTRLIAIITVAATILGGIGAAKYGRVRYEARASLMYRTDSRKSERSTPAAASSGAAAAPMSIQHLAHNTAVSLLRRTANLEAVRTNLNLSMSTDELGWRVGTQSEKLSEIILLRVEYLPTAEMAVRIANEMARVGVEDNRAFYRAQALQFARQFERQARMAEEDVKTTRAQLTAFQTTHQLLEVGADTKAFLDSVGAITERLHAARIADDSQLIRIDNYKKLIAQLPNEVLSQSLEDNPIKRRIANAEVALMEARTRYGADNPRVLLMEDSLREMRKTMTSESYNENRERVYVENPVKREFETEVMKLEAEKQVLEKSVQKIEERLAEVNRRYADLPKQQLDLAGLLQRHASAEALFSSFQNGASEARLAADFDVTDFDILEPARKATASRSKAAALLPVLSFLMALFGSTGVCLLRELLGSKLETSRQVEQAYNVPCLVAVPVTPDEAVADAFLPVCRLLYQRLTSLPPQEGALTLSVLSACDGEGKSTLAFLMARYWSGLGVPTAYLDFDAAPNPLLQPPVKLSGIDDYLSGKADWDSISFTQENITCFKRLANNGDLPEQLHGTAMRRLMDTLCAKYGCVIIDTPACRGDESAPLLARMTDCTVWIIGASKTTRSIVNHAFDSLDRVGVRPLGIVLNLTEAPTVQNNKKGKSA